MIGQTDKAFCPICKNYVAVNVMYSDSKKVMTVVNKHFHEVFIPVSLKVEGNKSIEGFKIPPNTCGQYNLMNDVFQNLEKMPDTNVVRLKPRQGGKGIVEIAEVI